MHMYHGMVVGVLYYIPYYILSTIQKFEKGNGQKNGPTALPHVRVHAQVHGLYEYLCW